MSNIGERLRKAREYKQLKQTQVMEKIGINNKTLSGYENNVSEPDIGTLNRLAELYEVSVDWLTGRETVSVYQYMPEVKKNEIDMQLMEAIRKLSDEKKKLIVEIIKQMSSDET